MERKATIENAKDFFGENFIGVEELKKNNKEIELDIPEINPLLPFSLTELEEKSKDFILVLAVSKFKDGRIVTIRTLRDVFGIDSYVSEPCFYNQDWYLKEKFIDESLDAKWMLIRKKVSEESRGKNPEILDSKVFLKAVQYAYVFFIYRIVCNKTLWENDFIWCSDIDSNSDRIYVGRYFDPVGIAKNGFSVHRHLKISNIYGAL